MLTKGFPHQTYSNISEQAKDVCQVHWTISNAGLVAWTVIRRCHGQLALLPRQILAVCCYSAALPLQGNVEIFHTWLMNGKEVASISTRPSPFSPLPRGEYSSKLALLLSGFSSPVSDPWLLLFPFMFLYLARSPELLVLGLPWIAALANCCWACWLVANARRCSAGMLAWALSLIALSLVAASDAFPCRFCRKLLHTFGY